MSSAKNNPIERPTSARQKRDSGLQKLCEQASLHNINQFLMALAHPVRCDVSGKQMTQFAPPPVVLRLVRLSCYSL